MNEPPIYHEAECRASFVVHHLGSNWKSTPFAVRLIADVWAFEKGTRKRNETLASFTIVEHFSTTPEKAFLALSDFSGASAFHQSIVKTIIRTKGPLRVGTKISETRKMFGKQETEELTITQFDPPRLIALEAFNHGAHYQFSFEIVPDDNGCEVTHTFIGTPQTAMAKIFSILFSFMNGSMAKMLKKDLKETKKHAESL